jgi:hypothetical protein
MSYDPSRTPIRELILQNVETVLRSIAPPSYASTILFVRRWNGNVALDVPEYPCALIVPLTERSDDSRSTIIEHSMQLGIVLGVRSDTWMQDMNRLLADVRVALLTDPSRGTVAATTRITDEDVYDGDPRQNIGSAQLVAEISYRTLYEDPTTAK